MRSCSLLPIVLLGGSLLFTPSLTGAADASAPAEAERPVGSYIVVDPAVVSPPADGTAELHSSNIIYLNNCQGGCSIKSGNENSRTNTSSIVDSNVTISQFAFGQSTWNAVVDCVTDMYAQFNIQIVDTRPTEGSYFMAIVAGSPSDAGMPRGVGGVAPFSCGVINNSITYSFANIYGGSVQQICEVVAQETAHAFGLDHEFYCPDPMTYRSGCGAKRFRDVDAECGENQARNCQCGGTTQNSVQKIMSVFGPTDPTPPTLTIVEPTHGQMVEDGFPVRVNAADGDGISFVKLVVNNKTVATLTAPPYAFNAPNGLSPGNQNVEVTAVDIYNSETTQTITVSVGSPCTKPSECGDGLTCIEGRCVAGPDENGGLGQICENDDQCASGKCASDGTDQRCIEECETSCPSGFACLNAGDVNVCWPGADGGGGDGGGCSADTHGTGSGLPIALTFLFGLFLFRRRC